MLAADVLQWLTASATCLGFPPPPAAFTEKNKNEKLIENEDFNLLMRIIKVILINLLKSIYFIYLSYLFSFFRNRV